MSAPDLEKRVAVAEAEAARALERAAEAGRALLDTEARAASDRAAAALASDALEESRRLRARETDELRAEIARLQDEIEKHRQWLTSIQSSTSWRITKPLRALR